MEEDFGPVASSFLLVPLWRSVAMRFFKISQFLLLLGSLGFLAACKIETPPVTITGNVTTINSGTLTCAASTAETTVSSGESFSVNIQVAGGIGPYNLSGINGTFLTTYTLPQTLTVSGTTSEVKTAQFTVTDNTGRSTTCQLAVTVTPEDDVSPLACLVAASTETPNINQNVTFTATASGGSGAYYFGQFVPGGSGVLTSSLTVISANRATAGARYTAAGLNTAVFYIADAAGNQANCAKTVNVQAGVSVSLVASPSSTVPATQAMTVTAIPSGFSATPTYTFSITGSGLNLTQSGAVATVTAVDATVTRTGTVTVTAVNGSQSATSSIPVTFTAQPSYLNCSISYTGGTYYPEESVPFSIQASTGEALTVTNITVLDGYVVGGVPSQYPYIKFYNSGYKSVTALARSASTGVLCNGGAALSTSIYISPQTPSQFSCTLTMTPNPTNTYTWILASVTASGYQGSYWLSELVAYPYSVASTYSSYLSNDVMGVYNAADYSYGYTYRYVYFIYPGTWRVVATVRDSAGRSTACTAYQTINY